MTTKRRAVLVGLGAFLLLAGAPRARAVERRSLATALLDQRLSDPDDFGRYADHSRQRPDAVAVPASAEPRTTYADSTSLTPAPAFERSPVSEPPPPVRAVPRPAPREKGLDILTVYKWGAAAAVGGGLLFTLCWWAIPTVTTTPYQIGPEGVTINGEFVPFSLGGRRVAKRPKGPLPGR